MTGVGLRKPVRKGYFRLYDVRLQGLRYGKGRAWFFSAALFLDERKPAIAVKDVFQIAEGGSRGVLLHTDRKEAGLVAAQKVGCIEITEKNLSSFDRRVRALATTPYIPTSILVTPSILRFITDPVTCAISYPDFLLSVKETMSKEAALSLLGTYVDGAWLLPQEYVLLGGMLVVPSLGIQRRAGGAVYGMPGLLFDILCPAVGALFHEEEPR